MCVCVLISREHENIVIRKDKLAELRAFMIPWGLGVYLQIILSTLPHILDFDSKVLALSMKRITEALRPPIRPFSARSYNRLSHADVILLDPGFLLGACTAPYLVGKAGSTFVRNIGAWLFFLSFFFLDGASFSHQHIGHNFANTKDKGQFK